jgi:hypothetical protein
MKRALVTQWKKLLSDLDFAEQAFDASYARLRQSFNAAEAGVKPARPLGKCLQEHLTATSCLLAMGRETLNFRKRHLSAA